MVECEFYLKGCELSKIITSNAKIMEVEPRRMTIYIDFCLNNKKDCGTYSGLEKQAKENLLEHWGPVA